MRTPFFLICVGLLQTACSHIPLSGTDLDRVQRPAFIARMAEEAGPRADVFRDDPVYRTRLKRLDPREADRRLKIKLAQAVTRFEMGERLRAGTFARLRQEPPWSHVVAPADVASALESFLVEDVPAHPPDYELLKSLGADSVVEFVVEDCGMRSERGKAYVFARGYGRMFLIGGGELWRKSFDVDRSRDEAHPLDPFEVGRNPDLYREAMRDALDSVAEDFARELQPERPARGTPSAAEAPGALSAPSDDVHKAGRENDTSKDEIPLDSPAQHPREEAPPSSEIRMNQRKDIDENHPATAPGLQDPTVDPMH